jgi:predicted SnoaL-like aldol condensation-catalyzing enzyme
MKDDAKENPPKHLEIKQTTCDGDLVMVHSQIILNDKDQSMVTVHIFKLNKSQIIELWDIVQQIPDDSPNQDGMF